MPDSPAATMEPYRVEKPNREYHHIYEGDKFHTEWCVDDYGESEAENVCRMLNAAVTKATAELLADNDEFAADILKLSERFEREKAAAVKAARVSAFRDFAGFLRQSWQYHDDPQLGLTVGQRMQASIDMAMEMAGRPAAAIESSSPPAAEPTIELTLAIQIMDRESNPRQAFVDILADELDRKQRGLTGPRGVK